MKTRAAVLWDRNEPWSVEEIELDDPKENELCIKLVATGLCHTDDHVRTGDLPIATPLVGGHEGAGIVDKIGPGVRGFAPGDHVVLAAVPVCGHCRWCSTGRQNLCDLGEFITGGVMISDGTTRVHARGRDIGTMALLGTFAEYVVVHEASVVKIDPGISLEMAALIGCGVTTGWGSAVYLGEVRPGETVVVVGAGGVGTSAIQGARLAGAGAIVAVDPIDDRRKRAFDFGATHGVVDMDEARDLVRELTRGVMADVAILAVGVGRPEHVAQLTALISKGGRAVLSSVPPWDTMSVDLPLAEFVLSQKKLIGNVFGGTNARADIPKLLDLYQLGLLKLDEMVTTTYCLDEINTGYQDMLDGKTVRGLIIHD